MAESTNVLELIAQHAQLEQKLKPVLQRVSQKLVSDLLATGVEPAKLGRAVGRSPSYILAVSRGKKCLSTASIVKVIQHASASAKDASNDSA